MGALPPASSNTSSPPGCCSSRENQYEHRHRPTCPPINYPFNVAVCLPRPSSLWHRRLYGRVLSTVMMRCCGGRSPPKCIEVADFLTCCCRFNGHVRVVHTWVVQSWREMPVRSGNEGYAHFKHHHKFFTINFSYKQQENSVLFATGNKFGTQRLPLRQEQQPPLPGVATSYN